MRNFIETVYQQSRAQRQRFRPWLALLAAVLLAHSADAAEFEGPRPEGPYEYQGRFEIPGLRIAETVDSTAPDFKKRLKELRSEGFTCIRKNSQTYLCSRQEKPSSWPSEVDAAIHKGMKGFRIDFQGPFSVPEFLIETSTDQEWLFREIVEIRGVRVGAFKFVKRLDGRAPAIAFPISEEQGIGFVEFPEAGRLSLRLTLSGKQGNRTFGYLVAAFLESM